MFVFSKRAAIDRNIRSVAVLHCNTSGARCSAFVRGIELRAIAADLPLASALGSSEVGRATNGAAKALLARVLLFTNDDTKMAEVATLCTDIINSGEYSLVSDYGDLFTEAGEWGSESVFEITHAANSASDWGRFGQGHSEGNVGVQFCGMRDYNGPDYAPGWGFVQSQQILKRLWTVIQDTNTLLLMLIIWRVRNTQQATKTQVSS